MGSHPTVEPTDAGDRRDPDLQDVLYDVLADRRRRALLHHLTGQPSPVPVDDVATELAAVEAGTDPDAVTAEQREAVLVALAHVHLPKLHGAGVVAWDREADEVALTSLLSEVSVTTPMTGSLFDASVSLRRRS